MSNITQNERPLFTRQRRTQNQAPKISGPVNRIRPIVQSQYCGYVRVPTRRVIKKITLQNSCIYSYDANVRLSKKFPELKCKCVTSEQRNLTNPLTFTTIQKYKELHPSLRTP